jgi:hypothetical protein
VAFSRILNDEEVVIVVNAVNGPVDPLFVIVDAVLNPVGEQFTVAFSNKPTPSQPDPVVAVGQGGTLTIHEVDGSISNGPAHVTRLSLQSFEAKILVKAV